jgi:hypothetical protein
LGELVPKSLEKSIDDSRKVLDRKPTTNMTTAPTTSTRSRTSIIVG